MKTRFKDSDKPLIPYLHGNPAALAGDNHPVFFLKRILRDYDLSPILKRYRSETVGRPPFDLFLMILLGVYAYYVSIRSTRKMEDLHGDSIGVRVIFPMRCPDHSTINRFRKDNETELAGLFLYVLQKCGDADMIDPDTAIVDGTKMKANAALSANVSEEEKIDRALEAIAACESLVSEDLSPNARAARERGRRSRTERRKIAREKLVAKKAKRQALLEEQKKKDEERAKILAETGKKPRGRKRKEKTAEAMEKEKQKVKVNTTDPESEIMKTSQGYLQGDNAQIAVDRNQIILAASVTSEQNDLLQLEPLLGGGLENLEKVGYQKEATETCLADAGYYSEENMRPREGRTVEILAPPARKSKTVVEALKNYAGKPNESPLASLPRTTPGGMAHSLSTQEGKDRYKKRGSTVEPTFGQIKGNRGTRTFMRRGKAACDAKWKLICAIHNLHKLREHEGRLKKTA